MMSRIWYLVFGIWYWVEERTQTFFIPNTKRAGFTLVELLVSIALFSIVGGLTVQFTVSLVRAQARAEAMSELHAQSRVAMRALLYEMRRGRGFEATTDFDVNLATTSGASLDIDMPDVAVDPTEFSVTGNMLYWKSGSASPLALTTDEVFVSELTFAQRETTNGRAQAINITLTLTASDPTGQPTDLSYTTETTVAPHGI